VPKASGDPSSGTFGNKMKPLFVAFTLWLAMVVSLIGQSPHNYTPTDGYVPDAPTAVDVGRVILEKIYGKENISRQLPLTATLKSGIWTVAGTLPKNYVGGVALIEIRKDDGKISRVTHGK
jgi:hypothetical protein